MKTKDSVFKNSACAIISAAMLIGLNAHALKVDDDENLKNYHNSISVQNLINGLNLTADQQKKILDLNYKIKKLQDAENSDPKAKKLKADAETAMKELNEYLAKNPEQENKEIQDKAAKANHARKEYWAERAKKLKTELARYSSELTSTLTKEQMQVVSTFKPCLVPPKDMRDPVRAGQASHGEQGEKALSRLREMKDPAKIKEAINKSADRIIQMTDERIYQMNDAQKAAKKEELVKILTQAQKMSATDFELKKSEILTSLRPEKGSKKTPEKVADEFSDNKAVKFLLEPDIVIPVLEKRIQSGTTGGLR